jgi:Outer membrane lipoprotein-sorting protein
MGDIRTLVVYIAMTFLCRVVMLSRSRKFGPYLAARLANCAYGMIQVAIVFLVLLLLLHPSRAAANPDLETVLTGSRQRIEKLDYRATGHLTRVEADGKRTSYKFVGKAHWFPDGLRLLCEISGPGAEEKTVLLLHMSVSGHVTIEAMLPGQKAASVLPFERWNDPLVGTDFSYEDMVESQFFWKNQELLAPEKYGARDCFVLKSTPGSQDRTHDDSVTSWIDRSILFPVHVVKTLHGTGQQKEFIYYGLRQNGGVWSASQVEAKVQGKPGSSILAIEGGSGKANLGRKDFDLGQSSAPAANVK